MNILSIILTFLLLYALIGVAYMHFRFEWIKEATALFIADNPDFEHDTLAQRLYVILTAIAWPWLVLGEIRTKIKVWVKMRKLNHLENQMKNNPTKEQIKAAHEFLDSLKQSKP